MGISSQHIHLTQLGRIQKSEKKRFFEKRCLLAVVLSSIFQGFAWAESCPNPGVYDLDASGVPAPADMIAWIDGVNGPDSNSPLYDIDGSGTVDEQDLQALIVGIAACRSAGTVNRNPGTPLSPGVRFGGPHVNVLLTPSSPGPYTPGENITVAVSIQRTQAGDDLPLRLIQFDVAVADPLISIALPPTHPGFLFWDFSSTPLCMSTPGLCGSDYLDFFIGSIFTVVYLGFTEDLTRQLIIPGDTTPLYLGSLDVTVPASPGLYILDLLNAGSSGSDYGARLDSGFANRITWLANQGDFSGGVLALMVGAVPVPALGEWGLGILTLMGLIGGTLLFRRAI
jgi:hypothetical protein